MYVYMSKYSARIKLIDLLSPNFPKLSKHISTKPRYMQAGETFENLVNQPFFAKETPKNGSHFYLKPLLAMLI